MLEVGKVYQLMGSKDILCILSKTKECNACEYIHHSDCVGAIPWSSRFLVVAVNPNYKDPRYVCCKVLVGDLGLGWIRIWRRFVKEQILVVPITEESMHDKRVSR